MATKQPEPLPQAPHRGPGGGNPRPQSNPPQPAGPRVGGPQNPVGPKGGAK